MGKMIWTPGVNLSADEGVLGQRYGHPSDAIKAGSDAVIVGSGIHGATDPVAKKKGIRRCHMGRPLTIGTEAGPRDNL